MFLIRARAVIGKMWITPNPSGIEIRYSKVTLRDLEISRCSPHEFGDRR